MVHYPFACQRHRKSRAFLIFVVVSYFKYGPVLLKRWRCRRRTLKDCSQQGWKAEIRGCTPLAFSSISLEQHLPRAGQGKILSKENPSLLLFATQSYFFLVQGSTANNCIPDKCVFFASMEFISVLLPKSPPPKQHKNNYFHLLL
jgi:hypothetical protein